MASMHMHVHTHEHTTHIYEHNFLTTKKKGTKRWPLAIGLGYQGMQVSRGNSTHAMCRGSHNGFPLIPVVSLKQRTNVADFTV